MNSWILIAVIGIAGLSQMSLGQSLQADFSMQGVTGQATFTWTASTLSVRLQIPEDLGSSVVEIRPMWVNYDAIDKCGPARLGEVLQGLSQSADLSNSDLTITYSNVSSLDYVEGHSIVIQYQSDKTICATIQKSTDHVTAEVVFRGTVFGHVYLRQANASGSSTRLVADLATQTDATMGDWRISNNFQSCEEFMTNVLANVYNPAGSSNACSTTNQGACAIGDLSSKLGKAYFSGRIGGSEGRRAYTDANLPLFGDHGVDGLLMIILPSDNGVKPACGVINVYKTRSATATFSEQGVKGTIKFTQKSPLDPTVTDVDLEGLGAQAGGYHVHLWPAPERLAAAQTGMCGGDRVSGHFNPFQEQVGVPSDPGYPSPASSTYDMYEVGDLSGKYGSLSGEQSKKATYTDWNLQLFGPNSVVARSLVIHRNDATASRWVCVNIEPDYPVVAAEAVLTYPVIGRVMFLQAQDRPDSDTSVFASLDYIDDRSDTQGHAWMIGDSFIGSDMLDQDVSQRCRSTGSTYNPERLWPTYNERQYTEVCTDNSPVACKTGDLSYTIGRLSIGNSAGSEERARKWFATSTNLPLRGPHSIVGKPLVIRTVENTASLACGRVTPVHPVALEAELTSGPVTGTVCFSQKVGFGSRQTMVQTSLDGMGESRSLMIYELPPTMGQSPCSDLGMVFDPLSVGDGQPTATTDDNYKVGDLSRHTALTEWSSYRLPLSGPNSIKGRSVAVMDGGSSVLGCAAIHWDMQGWTLLRATATFTGEVIGTITMHQHVRSDGAMSDTTIVTDLEYSNSSMQTLGHNWHTHVNLVSGDSQASSQRCMSTGPHYNPFMADIGLTSYSAECSRLNQLRCELGDQSKKTNTIDVGGGRKLHTDTYQPLLGMFTVQGRSIVVHVENKGAPRFTCADIVPQTSSPVVVTFSTPAAFIGLSEGDKVARVTRVYADSIRASPGELIAVIQMYSMQETTVAVHFIGPGSRNLRSRFVEYISDENRRDGLGQFVPILNGAGPKQINIFMVLLCLIPSVMFSWRILQ